MTLSQPAISADSHVCETDEVFADIDPAYKDTRPKAIFDENAGAVLLVEELGIKVPLGLV
jgi:hypothetical protein